MGKLHHLISQQWFSVSPTVAVIATPPSRTRFARSRPLVVSSPCTRWRRNPTPSSAATVAPPSRGKPPCPAPFLPYLFYPSCKSWCCNMATHHSGSPASQPSPRSPRAVLPHGEEQEVGCPRL